MHKKVTAIIIGIIAITSGVIMHQTSTYSTSGVTYTKPSNCEQETVNEIDLMRIAWNKNLKEIVEQEKAASEVVDEAFESMRTYRCWLDYLCETVLLSGSVSSATAYSSKVTKYDIDILPECVPPEDVVIPGTALKYLSQCRMPKGSTDSAFATKHYKVCRQLIALEFSEPSDNKGGSAEIENFKNRSSAYAGLEAYLKSTSATKKNTVLQNKLNKILLGMSGMESHMLYLSKYMQEFDNLLTCQIWKCD